MYLRIISQPRVNQECYIQLLGKQAEHTQYTNNKAKYMIADIIVYI